MLPAWPITYPSAQAVADLLEQGDDPEAVQLAEGCLGIVFSYVRAYTRDNGFEGILPADLAAVIMTATARLMSNPAQHKREQVGDYQVTPTPFVGFTIPEQIVLNQYRKRTL